MMTIHKVNSDLNIQKLFSEVSSKFKSLNKIDFIVPRLILLEYPDLIKNKVESREFKSPCINKDDEVGGNLYKWIHQSYSVLWEVDKGKNEMTLYVKTNKKLGQRFATLLKMEKDSAVNGVMIMSAALALTELHLESKFEYARLALAENLEYQKIFDRFISMFEKDNKLFL